MANDLAVPSHIQCLAAEFESWSTERLRHELAETLGLTASGLLRAAVMIKTLEDRGEDLHSLRMGMLLYLQRIAWGQLLPEVVVRFASMPSLINSIGSLPLPEQQRLASGASVCLVVYASDGQKTHRMLDPLDLTLAQQRQVFSVGGLRTESQQIALLDDRRTKEKHRQSPEYVCGARVDPERGSVRIGNQTFSEADLKAILAALRRKS